MEIELLPAIPHEALAGAFNVGRNQYEAQPLVEVFSRTLRLTRENRPLWVIGLTDDGLNTAHHDSRSASASMTSL